MLSKIQNFDINFQSVNPIQKACNELGSKIGKEKFPKVSFDVADIKGKVTISTQKFRSGSGIMLNLSDNKSSASILLRKGKVNDLKSYLTQASDSIKKQVDSLSATLKKVSEDESKSLTGFTC